MNPEVVGESCPEVMQLLFDDVSTDTEKADDGTFRLTQLPKFNKTTVAVTVIVSDSLHSQPSPIHVGQQYLTSLLVHRSDPSSIRLCLDALLSDASSVKRFASCTFHEVNQLDNL